MNRKSVLGLILFASIVIAGLFLSTLYLTSQSNQADEGTKSYSKDAVSKNDSVTESSNKMNATASQEGTAADDGKAVISVTPAVSTAGSSDTSKNEDDREGSGSDSSQADTFSTSIEPAKAPQLIYDSSKVDYKAYIPEMTYDNELKEALDIENPSIDIDAESAVLIDADTKEVLYYKNPVQVVFPASTAKLLTSLVALYWCSYNEEVTVGDEITMVAPDSTKADIDQGQILTVRNLLEGMLLPSGNDAAYAIAAYVGRKSLDEPKATKEEAVSEFVRLMNEKAQELGVKNSCFKTPDGYDAVGQYTTAYDMGMIGAAASLDDTIVDISHKSRSRNVFISGEDVTWKNTNKLVTRYSGQYYSRAIGLKTGTSSMAGRCIIAAAEKDGKKVVCAIMDSSSAGRWEDAIALLKYGMEKTE